MPEQQKTSGFLWFVAGAAIGVAIALLYAPQPGAETRKRISRTAEKGREALAESGSEIFERGRELYDKGKHIADEAAELFDRGKKLVQG